MRALLAGAVALVLMLGAATSGDARPRGQAVKSPLATLKAALNKGMKHAGGSSGAYVVDLDTDQVLFSAAADKPRLPASVEKLYTTSTALLRYGPNASLLTTVYGVGSMSADGRWNGNLYIHGGGDPTFGSASFDSYAYGGGATMQRLVANLVRATGIRSVHGAIVGDESYFDSKRGTPATNYAVSSDVEGELSALVYDRGLADEQGTAFQKRPALFTTHAFAAALRAAHVSVPRSTRIYAGVTPAGAQSLAVVHSPRMATLIKLTNTPSDNFFAETLLKGIGARFADAGTTAAGVTVVKAQIAKSFGIHPSLNDGSGLSYADFSTPIEVELLLAKMESNQNFVNSLAVAGESGTLIDEGRGTAAQGNCRGKTGTLRAVANLAGYCRAKDGHTLAFAFLMNSVDPTAGHDIETQMAVALAKYNG